MPGPGATPTYWGPVHRGESRLRVNRFRPAQAGARFQPAPMEGEHDERRFFLRPVSGAGGLPAVNLLRALMPRRHRDQQPAMPPGQRLYAIGDIHGCYREMLDLLKQIGHHDRTCPGGEEVEIVLLGDLVDRGPDSAAVLETVRYYLDNYRHFTVLKGNHEDVMVRGLSGNQAAFRQWLEIGGDATLRSFGFDPPSEIDETEIGAVIEAARAHVTQDRIDWMRDLPCSLSRGDYFFCHAGVRPHVPLRRQAKADLMWIRDSFLTSDVDHGAIVVHGHTIAPEVQMCTNRIGIDTGAYKTGVLTALCLDGTERTCLSTVGR